MALQDRVLRHRWNRTGDADRPYQYQNISPDHLSLLRFDLGPPPGQVLNRFPFPLVHLRINHPDLEEDSLRFQAATQILKFRR
jgi:hypothetical protein